MRKEEHIRTLLQKLNDLDPLQAQVCISPDFVTTLKVTDAKQSELMPVIGEVLM